MNEFLEQFLLESRELVDDATRELLALEQAPEEKDRLDAAFRAFHTLKGGAGIVDFSARARALHVAEEALSVGRGGDEFIASTLVGDCLNMIDQVVRWLNEIEATGELPISPDGAADAAIARLQHDRRPAYADAPRNASPEPVRIGFPPPVQRVLDEQLLLIEESHPAGRRGRVVAAGRVVGNILRHLSRRDGLEDVERAVAAFLANDDAAPLAEAVLRLTAPNPAVAKAAPPEVRSDRSGRHLRVDSDRVDTLVALTAELIVAKNAVARIAKSAEESGNALAGALKGERARLDRLLARLQETVLNLRVVPLRTVFQRFQRIVRELAIELSKPTVLVIECEETETDRTISDTVFEPLLHIVRNAMDHGIENEPERRATGKPVIATIALRARRHGENVVIEVRDDGRGIDTARLRNIARERNLLDSAALASASEQDWLDLIFMPGFSTKEAVTDLSGRGVGMDAVRSAVERIGGRVGVESALGQGATFRLTLPFSVMVTRVMTVETCGQTFGIPLDAIVESLRVPRSRVLTIGAVETFVLRDRTIPLIDLAEVLGSPRKRDPASDVLAVVVSVAGQVGALEVDELGERKDVILRPIDGLLSGAPGIAGATLTDDGQVLLVLDLQELLR
jgi:two-component system chemotaxis sensor kinase CheA